MPTIDFREASNADILNVIRDGASLDYQHRIPEATQAGVSDVLRTLRQFPVLQNQFFDGLVNRIGAQYAHSLSWKNPLAEFKRNSLEYGAVIQEMKSGLLQAKEYTAKRDYLEKDIFGAEVPYVEANYHEVNRQDWYKFSLNHSQMQRAVNGEGELNQILSMVMEAPVTSDNLDEFLLMTRLLSEYESMGGFHHVKIADVASRGSTSADAKDALRMIRATAENMQFLSTSYNAAKLPVSARPDELMLIATPEFAAALDVEALAGMFNIERGNINNRIVTVPQQNFGIEGVQGILTTKDFFVVADTLYTTKTIENPVGLNMNYILHHHQIISASRFVPAIQFSSIFNDEIINVENPVTSVSAIAAVDSDGATVTELEHGKRYQLTANGVTTPASGDNRAVRWSLTGNALTETNIDQYGLLTVSGEETATTLNVVATSTWINPANAQAESKTTTRAFAVTGDPVAVWPVEHDHDGDGVPDGQDPAPLDPEVSA